MPLFKGDRLGPSVIQRAPLATAAVLLALVKSIQFAIDPQVLFFHDSGAFILNGMGLAFLPHRSYVYGALLRLVAVPFHSLRVIVAMQIIMGGLTAWLMAVALVRFMQVRAWIAILAALAFAIDPVQIVHEHLVMSETAALLVMATFLVAALKYLQDPSPRWLVILSFLGVLLVSLRIVYLPAVLAAAVLLPVSAYFSSSARRPRVLAIALVASCGSAALFHLGYRYLTGWLAGREPAYHYMTGFFLLASVAPIIESGDTGDARVASAIMAQNMSGFPLASRASRSDQLWAPEGFVARLTTIFGGDEREADQAAQRLARAAIQRNPLGFLKLGLENYLSFWGGVLYVRSSLEWENGSQLPPAANAHEASVIRSVFGVDVSNQHTLRTPSRRYHILARHWSLFLLASPFLAGLALWLGPANPRGTALLLGWNCLLLAATCFGAVSTVYRYLHPFSFTALAAAAILCEILVSRRTRA
jgi:hypothetical protein